jgi:shikimate kinase
MIPTDSITIIGMSNVGKTRLSRLLAETKGFHRIGCDERIAQKLEHCLAPYKGTTPEQRMAAWMGFPYEPDSLLKQGRYIEEETQVMHEAIRTVCKGSGRFVIDTTGSVVHTDEKVLNDLQEITQIVLLDIPDGYVETLYQRYLKEPKPVIWGDQFRMHHDDDPQEALRRCYPLLLQKRNELYRKIAHVIIAYDVARASSFTVDDFLKKVTT